jgi:hypothetical protein
VTFGTGLEMLTIVQLGHGEQYAEQRHQKEPPWHVKNLLFRAERQALKQFKTQVKESLTTEGMLSH